VAYVTPPTFNSGDVLAASDLNILGDDIKYLKGITDGVGFSGCRVTRAAATSTTSGSLYTVSFTAEAFDYGGWYSSGTNVVVPAGAIPAGYTTIAVDCIASAVFAVNGTGRRFVIIKQNGTSIGGPSVSADSGEDTLLQAIGVGIVAAGDILTLDVKQTSGGALNVSSMNLFVLRRAPVA
jgi:hypothetical protein